MDIPITKTGVITAKHQITIPKEFFYLFSSAKQVSFCVDKGKLVISPISEDEDIAYNNTVSGHPIIGAGKTLLSEDYDLTYKDNDIFSLFDKEWED